MITKKDIEIDLCRNYFALFSKALFPALQFTQFHINYYKILHQFAIGNIKRLIISIPPQHGKSQGSTILLPAYILGRNPDTRIALSSYSTTFASKFNRSIQRIMSDDVYKQIFPNTQLPNHGDKYIRTSTEFEISNYSGFLKSIGRGGGLTGNTIDISIIDDLYKNSMEGNSPIIRASIWDWYITTVRTRFHNNTREIIVFTRWHEDDLIGQILQQSDHINLTSFEDINPEFNGYHIINYEAIKESEPTKLDNRIQGEPLFPERHSLEKLIELRQLDSHYFNCLYQGKPSSKEGLLYTNTFDTYEYIDKDSILKYANYCDTADMGNDYLCSISYQVDKEGIIYITDIVYTKENMDKSEVYVANQLISSGTKISYIESNNGGRGFARAIQKLVPNIQVKWFHQSLNKEARIISNAPLVNSKLKFPKDWHLRWPDFYHHVTTFKRIFSANLHDDAPDVLTGIIEKEITNKKTFRIY